VRVTLPAAPQRAQGFARTGETRRAPGDDVAPRAVASVLLAGLRAARACVSAGREWGGRGAPQRRAQDSTRRAAAEARAGEGAAWRGGR
jgi:hypothetical protein